MLKTTGWQQIIRIEVHCFCVQELQAIAVAGAKTAAAVMEQCGEYAMAVWK
jgi:hypothetical protein